MGATIDFSLFSILFTLMFFFVFGMILYMMIRNIIQWNKNNHAPRLTVAAEVVTKRMDVSHHHDGNTHITSSTTCYYATFQVESGDRIELSLNSTAYGQIAEGDCGRLTFQGTRYLAFDRQSL